MSRSNSHVGYDFADLKPHRAGKGSNMSVTRNLSENPHNLGPTFEHLAHGFSYQTEVARIVRNNFTNMRELWLTPMHYSQSTQRHVGHYRTGFAAWCRKNQPNMENINEQIFITSAVRHGGNRNDKEFAQGLYLVTSTMLGDVDIPRTREATRRGVLTSCQIKLAHAVRLMAQGIPAQEIHAETIINLYNLQVFVANLMETPDIDEVRAAVRAHIALNHSKNN